MLPSDLCKLFPTCEGNLKWKRKIKRNFKQPAHFIFPEITLEFVEVNQPQFNMRFLLLVVYYLAPWQFRLRTTELKFRQSSHMLSTPQIAPHEVCIPWLSKCKVKRYTIISPTSISILLFKSIRLFYSKSPYILLLIINYY